MEEFDELTLQHIGGEFNEGLYIKVDTTVGETMENFYSDSFNVGSIKAF